MSIHWCPAMFCHMLSAPHANVNFTKCVVHESIQMCVVYVFTLQVCYADAHHLSVLCRCSLSRCVVQVFTVQVCCACVHCPGVLCRCSLSRCVVQVLTIQVCCAGVPAPAAAGVQLWGAVWAETPRHRAAPAAEGVWIVRGRPTAHCHRARPHHTRLTLWVLSAHLPGYTTPNTTSVTK